MIVAQITDTHIKASGRPAYGRVDTAACLRRTVAYINALRPAVDAVICTGDLTDTGTAEEYAALRPLLDDLSCPYFVVPGNHDTRDGLVAAFADLGYLDGGQPFVGYAVDRFPLRLVGFDTTLPGQPFGVFDAARADWLDAVLAARPQAPTLVFGHHPPFLSGIAHMDAQNLLDPGALETVLRRHPQLRHAAFGHVHRAIDTVFAGVPASVGPNAAHAVTFDLTPDGPATFSLEPAMLRLFTFGDDGRLTAHLSFVDRVEGPYPFYQPSGDLID